MKIKAIVHSLLIMILFIFNTASFSLARPSNHEIFNAADAYSTGAGYYTCK